MQLNLKPLTENVIEGDLNTSGIEAVGHGVLLRPYEPQITEQGIIAIPLTVSEKHEMQETRGIVIAVGSECWKDESQPRAKLGDRVIVTRYCGMLMLGPWDGQKYRIVNDRDIFAVIVKEKAHGNQ